MKVGIALFGAALLAAANPTGHWIFNSIQDKMRDQRTDVAELSASTVAVLGAPFRGPSRATLVVTRTKGWQVVHVVVENAIPDCSHCDILVRLDSEPARY